MTEHFPVTKSPDMDFSQNFALRPDTRCWILKISMNYNDYYFHNNTIKLKGICKMELNDSQKEIIKFIKMKKSAFEIIRNRVIKLEKIDSSSKYVIYIKENDNKYIKDLKSESALTKFEQQNIVPSKYFSKFAKNFRTQDEETRYKNEKFDKLRNGKVVWIVSFLCLLLSTLFAFLGVYSCSTNKTKSENNNTNQDLPKTLASSAIRLL